MLAFALMAAPLSAQSLKESAALLPVSFLGLPQTQAQFLLNRLQERLSTEFTLVAQSEVADAFDRAVKALPGAECTEENCLALLQQYLKVSLVFNLQVVHDKDAGLTQLSLSLTEGRRRTVRTELCESCSLKALLNSLDKVTGILLLERRRDRQIAQAKPGIRVEPETLELREGGVSGTLAVSVQSPLGGRVVLGLQSDPVGLGFQPTRLEFNQSNWSEPQTVEVFAGDDEAITGTQEIKVRVLVVEAEDMNYGFVDPEIVAINVLEDDEQGRLRLISRPDGAQILIDGAPHLDYRGKPSITPASISLLPGTFTLTVKRSGFQPERIKVKVNKTNLGTRSVMLEPLPAVVAVRVPEMHRDGELLLDGQHRVPLSGKTKLELKLEPGRHTVQLRHKNAESEVQTLMLKPGKRTEAVFGPMQLAPSQKQRTTAQVASPEWSVGVGLEQIVAKGSKFPWNRVAWSLPRIHLQNVNGTGGFEVGYLSGAGKTETFTASDNQKNYVVSSVNVQRLSLQYHSSPFAGLGISAIGGINQTSLAFSSDSGTLQHSSLGLEGGLCHSLKMGKFRLRTDAMMTSSSSISLNLGVGYAF